MWAVSWQAWNVCHVITRWTVRHFSGQRYPATRGISRQRRVSIPSLSSQCASSRRKPTIWILPRRSESRWQTASVASRCILNIKKSEYLKRVATATLFKYRGLGKRGIKNLPFDIPICRGSLSCHNNFPSIAFKVTILIEIPIKTPSCNFFRIV